MTRDNTTFLGRSQPPDANRCSRRSRGARGEERGAMTPGEDSGEEMTRGRKSRGSEGKRKERGGDRVSAVQ